MLRGSLHIVPVFLPCIFKLADIRIYALPLAALQVSAESVRKYMPKRSDNPKRKRDSTQRWTTFIHNHAEGILACDFFVIVTANFRILYGFVMLEIGSRRIVHTNVTEHPTAQWTLQQFRQVMDFDHKYKFVLHDRDSIFSKQLDRSVSNMGVKILKSPVRSPTANAFCERVIGSIRRECLDHIIPINELHICRTLKQWVKHYNQGRPHMSLGPGVPDFPNNLPVLHNHQHRLPNNVKVNVTPILGGLHHEYWLDKAA